MKNQDGRLSSSLKLDDRLPKATGEGMLVAIAPDVEAISTLEVGVRAGAKVLVLNPQRDSIAQITEAIVKSKISSLHLVGHGVPGSISLGGTVRMIMLLIPETTSSGLICWRWLKRLMLTKLQ
ncbi:MAG: DUF4347 domain-containing protein [Okeania sp. SIO3I5]|uniref:DUF4347 domain-containing protein n=1 Tax=Okeania sp. SIO3I5 TaxID=2607805 RepID=UPI0013BB7A4C|nr:DUF4347 domain-containing protein [Okeania sp. SIO3I5]NEQ36709.1 DUF4347 domain-containing protein [Okeania sp. SIO3I5]